MSGYRLQVLIPGGLHRQVRKAAQRNRLSTSAWVRKAIQRHLADDPLAADALNRLRSLDAPTGDLEQMLSEIGAGRS